MAKLSCGCDLQIIVARIVAAIQMLFFMVLTPYILCIDTEMLFQGIGKRMPPNLSASTKAAYYTLIVTAAAASYGEFWAGFALLQATRQKKTPEQRSRYFNFWLLATSAFVSLLVLGNFVIFLVQDFYPWQLAFTWMLPAFLFLLVAGIPLWSSFFRTVPIQEGITSPLLIA